MGLAEGGLLTASSSCENSARTGRKVGVIEYRAAAHNRARARARARPRKSGAIEYDFSVGGGHKGLSGGAGYA